MVWNCLLRRIWMRFRSEKARAFAPPESVYISPTSPLQQQKMARVRATRWFYWFALWFFSWTILDSRPGGYHQKQHKPSLPGEKKKKEERRRDICLCSSVVLDDSAFPLVLIWRRSNYTTVSGFWFPLPSFPFLFLTNSLLQCLAREAPVWFLFPLAFSRCP